MFSLKETQRFEQFFWDRTSIDIKIEDAQKIIAMIEDNYWLRKLVALLEDLQGKEVLDCGCAVGNLSVYLRMRDVYIEGFDVSSEMV